MADVSALDKENVVAGGKALPKRAAEQEASKGDQAKRKAVLRPSTRFTVPNVQSAADEPSKPQKPVTMGPPPPRVRTAADAEPAVRGPSRWAAPMLSAVGLICPPFLLLTV